MDLSVYRNIWKGIPDDEGMIGRMEGWAEVYAGSPPWAEVKAKSVLRKYTRRMNMLNVAK